MVKNCSRTVGLASRARSPASQEALLRFGLAACWPTRPVLGPHRTKPGWQCTWSPADRRNGSRGPLWLALGESRKQGYCERLKSERLTVCPDGSAWRTGRPQLLRVAHRARAIALREHSDVRGSVAARCLSQRTPAVLDLRSVSPSAREPRASIKSAPDVSPRRNALGPEDQSRRELGAAPKRGQRVRTPS